MISTYYDDDPNGEQYTYGDNGAYDKTDTLILEHFKKIEPNSKVSRHLSSKEDTNANRIFLCGTQPYRYVFYFSPCARKNNGKDDHVNNDINDLKYCPLRKIIVTAQGFYEQCTMCETRMPAESLFSIPKDIITMLKNNSDPITKRDPYALTKKDVLIEYSLDKDLFSQSGQFSKFVHILNTHDLYSIVDYVIGSMKYRYGYYLNNKIYKFQDYPQADWETRGVLTTKGEMYTYFKSLYRDIIREHVDFYTKNSNVPVEDDETNVNKHILTNYDILRKKIVKSKKAIIDILLLKLSVSRYFPSERRTAYFVDSIEYGGENSFINAKDLFKIYEDWHFFTRCRDDKLSKISLEKKVAEHILNMNKLKDSKINPEKKQPRINGLRRQSWKYLRLNVSMKKFMTMMYQAFPRRAITCDPSLLNFLGV
jgi:hypothetical protein